MENTLLLRELLHKYFHGKLTKKELTDFRSVVNEMSDEMFKKELDFIWNNENDVIPMDTLTKNNMSLPCDFLATISPFFIFFLKITSYNK